MNSNDDKEKELRRKQKELEEREKLLRLKEIEKEIYERAEREKEERIRDQQTEPDFYPTRKDNPPENKLVRWQKKAMNINVRIVTPGGIIWEGSAQSVILPSSEA